MNSVQSEYCFFFRWNILEGFFAQSFVEIPRITVVSKWAHSRLASERSSKQVQILTKRTCHALLSSLMQVAVDDNCLHWPCGEWVPSNLPGMMSKATKPGLGILQSCRILASHWVKDVEFESVIAGRPSVFALKITCSIVYLCYLSGVTKSQ